MSINIKMNPSKSGDRILMVIFGDILTPINYIFSHISFLSNPKVL